MHDLESLFEQIGVGLRLNRGNRSHSEASGLDLVIDRVDHAACMFIRATGSSAVQIHLNGVFRLLRCASGGWLLQSRDSSSSSYWVPAPIILRRVSTQGHILEERTAEWTEFDVGPSGVQFVVAPPDDSWVLDAVIWKLDDPSLLEDLKALAPVETQGYFLLGSHTRYGRPADLYRHLIHGWVYEDRYAWPHQRRICSENDAHAFHLIFSGLDRGTGKVIYRLLKAQLLLSVLSRQSPDGAFRHGEWTDAMESHFRLHCSAMHLMMDSLIESDDYTLRRALERAASYMAEKHDSTNVGAWFYHDELECSEDGMQRSPFQWWPSTALGKSPQNMLVLNTQLDTLVALHRYSNLMGDTQYAPLVESGYEAASKVLSLRPMEWLYRLVFSAIGLTLLPTEKAARLPLSKRMWKRVGWQVFVPALPRLKTRFPRLVMPGGYIDRELSLQTWAYDYLAVNLMDLVRAARGTHGAAFIPLIRNAFAFCARMDIARRWLEHKGRTYAIGFYAEALYLQCLRVSRPEFDAMLAGALILCMGNRIGLPPSLAGGNAEAQTAPRKVPQPMRAEIAVANLSCSQRASCLVVNSGKEGIRLEDALRSVPTGWRIPATELPPGGWLRLEA